MFRRDKDIVKVAVFDFDGTCISGNSPVALVVYMIKRGMVGPTVILRIASWAFCYKLHLPQSESWVRGLVFAAFEGRPRAEVDRFLRDFCDAEIEKLWRPQAIETMQSLRDAGYKVLLVSATFEPIVLRAIEGKPVDAQVSTRMHVAKDGTYTRDVEGDPVEGPEKISALRRLADVEFGANKWELVYSFGDHYSDLPVLAAADHPQAVTPDTTLERYARRHKWAIHNWDDPKEPPMKVSE